MRIVQPDTIAPTMLEDAALDKLIADLAACWIDPSETLPLGEILEALTGMPSDKVADYAKHQSKLTRFGHALELFLFKLIEELACFDEIDRDLTPKGKIRDIRLISREGETIYLYVQARTNSKPSSSYDQIRRKVDKLKKARHIIAIPQLTKGLRTPKSKTYEYLYGPDLYEFISDGDNTLYSRILDAARKYKGLK